MKQVENQKSKYVSQSWSDKYHPEIRDSPNTCWKYNQKRSQGSPPGRCSRSPTAEPVASCYFSSNSYKLHKDYTCSGSTNSKHTSSHNTEISRQPPTNRGRSNRDKHYSSNVAIIRKKPYADEIENSEKLNYIDEETEHFMGDNIEDDGDEEEDDREETGEFLDKDYEEQEADDEIDEESDAPREICRMHRGDRNEDLLRNQQRWKHSEQQQNFRKLRYELSPSEHSHTVRYYHNINDHNVPEPLSEEDFTPVPVSFKYPTKRLPIDCHNWTQSRSSTDRYGPATVPIPSTRRARTKPELEQPIETEFSKTKKCSRCGSLSSKKNPPSNGNNCRLEDRLNFPTKGPIGDEPKIREHVYRGCYNVHNVDDVDGINGSPICHSYLSKPHRARDVKSPIYEVPEHGHMTDKIGNDYKRSSGRYSKDVSKVGHEKSKLSMHTSHVPGRSSSRYVE